MWKKTIILVIAAIISLSGGFGVGYIMQNGGFAGLPALIGFGAKEETVQDWTGKTLTTGDNIVNVRKTAENEGEIITTLNKNTEVYCVSQDENGWCKVRIMDDVEGYVLSTFLTYTGDYEPTGEKEEPKKEEKAFVKVTGSYAHIRKEPTAESESVAMAFANDVLAKESEADGWVKVTTADGVEGYIASDLVAASESSKAENAARAKVTITNSYANIRTSASADSAQVTKMNQGETATYLGEENGWYHILLDSGEEGYVRNDLASSDAE